MTTFLLPQPPNIHTHKKNTNIKHKHIYRNFVPEVY